MQRMTMREAMKMLDPEYDGGEQYLYLYLEGEIVFYVGKSSQPFERLQEHIGQGDDKRSMPWPDPIGRLILENRPASLEWTVQVTPLTELRTQMKLSDRVDIDTVERELIARFHPCLNRTCNRNPTPLPEKYRKFRISNAGIKL